MLGVDEQTLFTEAARMKRKQWEKNRTGKVDYIPEPHYHSPRQSDSYAAATATATASAFLFETEEREIIRLMLNYPDKIVIELPGEHRGEMIPIKVMDFFLQEMETDNLVPENPLYAKIFREFQDRWGTPGLNIQTMLTNSHLINFDTTVVRPDPVTKRLQYNSTGTGSGRCYLLCHGVAHSPLSYTSTSGTILSPARGGAKRR